MKNLFGLIPDPVRAWWHDSRDSSALAPRESRLARSILDINKVYGALFELAGVFEAPRNDGPNPFTRDVGMGKGVAQLDAILNHVTGYNQDRAAYISAGNNMFGAFDDELLKEAESHLSGWFPAPKKPYFSKT